MTNSHAAWGPLLDYEKLTLDSGPAPADFTVGGTLTGGTSGKTSTVVAKLSSTVYLIKARNGEYSDGEIISDGTNSRDCGTGYPTITQFNMLEDIAVETTGYKLLPEWLCKKLKSIRALAKSSGYISRREMKLIGRALEYLGENTWRDGVA